MKITLAVCLVGVLAVAPSPASAQDASLFNSEIAISPWAGESPSKGTFSVRHEGKRESPAEGYFKKREPGEIAEFHLFVPNELDSTRTVPLLIVYHGGEDGTSGKYMCKRFARLSTSEHPVIVLSPNMYTMDAYNELVAEGKLPIDTRRVVVYGHSSGGMGVRSAMAEFLRTAGRFRPAALICASTTASLGRVSYPPCPYYVMAGEKETPAFVTNEILKNRRRTCRIHALEMQRAFREVRYIEVKGTGHSVGTPTHQAVIQHAIAVSAREPGVDALESWFDAEVTAIARLTPKSSYVDRDRAFLRYDRCRALARSHAGTRTGEKLEISLARLDDAKHWSAELAARKAYYEIVAARPDDAMKTRLGELLKSAPETEYGRNRTREKLSALQEIQVQPPPEDLPDGPPILNPYFPNVNWRVWRDDATPVPNVQTLVRAGKEKKLAVITLAPTPEAKRIYPSGPLEAGKPILWVTRAKPSRRFSGMWDDVYASWSGLHGYVRSTWHTKGGSAVHLRPSGLDHIMHFVETRKTAEILRCGINFVHQSTTGMAHTITNAYDQKTTASYEKIYFSDCLVTAPAHASFTEAWADRTNDLYIALVPTLFNSVGSSNSETLAITKMMIVGGYLPPESKVVLKRHGLYPSALLYMWKASLPYDVPYDHELRHRIAYRALGRNDQFKGGYGHAGSERGNLSLEFHCYDEIAHMRNMIRMAQSMTVLPPEAILQDVQVEGGRSVYNLKKTALVLQEPGQDVTVTLSTAGCYDLRSRPITVRFKLLYGNPGTTCEPAATPDTWVIRVPWDDALPEGRTAVALIANNGVHDGNPAIVNVYRKRQNLPPPGTGPRGYSYNSPHANRRPVILGLQDRIVKAGETVRIPLRGVDPEGRNVRFYKRAGEPGELDGNLYTLKVPGGPAGTAHAVTFIASDSTAGNSYSAKSVRFVVAPSVHAHIDCDRLVGPAPLTVKVSAKGSCVASGKMEFGWEFTSPTPKMKAAEWTKQKHEPTATHTFAKPGLYEIALTVKSGKDTDRETLTVWVTRGPSPAPAGGLVVEGNGARIADGDDRPSAFDHTHFGTAPSGGRIARTFDLFNRGGKELVTTSRTVAIGGPHAKDFRITRAPRKHVAPGGHAPFVIEFRPQGGGSRSAEVTVRGSGASVRFAVSGEAAIDQKKFDARARPSWLAAKKLVEKRAWARAEAALVDFLERWAGATWAPEATALLERIRTDPEIQKEIKATARTEEATRAAQKMEARAKALFDLAENFAENDRADLAVKTWKEIVAKYPDTTYAEKARRRLER